MATDDFTEEFEDEPLPEEFEEEPLQKKARPQLRPAPRPEPVAPKRPQTQAQAPASAPVQTQQIRFSPFEIPTRVGVFDNIMGKPLMEESPKSMDKLDLIMAKIDILFGLEVELMNKIDELQKNI